MNLLKILDKQKKYEAFRNSIQEITIVSYEKAFELEYTHHSTAIEGNG